ncbi:MAG: transglycosylase SLT domain-containing protein [Myxococcota bacterium]|nr:transglycosylase SLT domain-containing protein [Myxococcota bacterium]
MFGGEERRCRRIATVVLGTALLFLVPGLLRAAQINNAFDSVAELRTSQDSGHGVPLDAQERRAAQALGQALAALQAGDLKGCQRHLEQASGARPISDYVEWVRIRCLIASGQSLQASKKALSMARKFPETPLRADFYRLAGEAFDQEGESAEARSAWQSALALTSDPAQRSVLESALGLSQQAELSIQSGSSSLQAPQLPSQRSPEAALAWANARMEEGRGAQAAEAFQEALAGGLEPESSKRARFQLGTTLFRLRRYDEALPIFEQMGLDPEGRFWRARTLARLGRVEESINGFEALAGSETGPVALRSAYLVATLLEGRGKPLRAMAHYRRVASDSPDQDRAIAALWRLGWSAWKRGDVANARSHFSEMSERSTDEAVRLQARYWKARATGRLGNTELSRQEFELIAREWPLSYYGWRSQVRLERFNTSWQGGQGVPAPEINGGTEALSDEAAVRIALLTEAGLLPQARSELVARLGPVTNATEKVRVGRLWIAAGDYHRAQQLVVDGGAMALARGIRNGEEAIFWLAWPPAYSPLVAESLQDLDGVEPSLVWAIMREESGFRPAVMSSAGAMGLLQLMPETARRQAERSGLPELEEDERLFDPPVNIALGSAYLEYLANRFPGRPSAIIASYNAGPNAVGRWTGSVSEDDEWVEDIPYSQTRRYVKRVLRSLYVYRSLYGQTTARSGTAN